MITEHQIYELRVESTLANTFAMATDDTGKLWAVFGDYIVDHNTFKALMLWKIAGHTSYMRIMNKREDHVEFIKTINQHNELIQNLQGFNIFDHIYGQFINLTNEQTATNLIDRYEQYINA